MCIFFFTDTATTEIYTYFHTLSLHDALPIWIQGVRKRPEAAFDPPCAAMGRWQPGGLTDGLWRDVAAPPPRTTGAVPPPTASPQGGFGWQLPTPKPPSPAA